MSVPDEKKFSTQQDAEPVEESDDDIGEERKANDGKFEFHAKNIFLTYPQSGGYTMQALQQDIETEAGRMAEYHICQEDHADEEGVHLHALVKFNKKLHFRDPRKFDFHGLHPNITSVKNWNKAKSYIYKGSHGKPPRVINNTMFDYAQEKGFKRRLEDFEERDKVLKRARKNDMIQEIVCYGVTYDLDWGNKHRHFWFWGPADMGKSTQIIKNNFKANNVAHFKAKIPADEKGQLRNTFEDYRQEKFIIFDDMDVHLYKENLCTLSALEDDEDGECPFPIRYTNICMKKEVIIIVIANHYPGFQRASDWRQEDWFNARFTTIEIVQGADGRGAIVMD